MSGRASALNRAELRRRIREVPDFPRPGILFYDISPLLADAVAWGAALDAMAELLAPAAPELLVGVESRGFLLAAPLADRLGLGFVMARKPGKLPGPTRAHAYELEYGSETLELQDGAVRPGMAVAVVDDLVATGGTAAATAGPPSPRFRPRSRRSSA